jgi:hypothetical protein
VAVAGRVGVGAVNSGAWFDNIRVSDPSVLTLAPATEAGGE